MKKITIGICSIGSGVGQSVVDSCKFFREKVSLIGLGNNPLAYGAYDCDKYAIIPSYYDDQYIIEIEKIIKKHEIQILIPGHDDEALLLAKNHEKLTNIGVKVLSSPYELVLTCRHKSTYAENFHEAANYFVKTYKAIDIKDEFFPLIAKPEQGFASKGIEIITTRDDLEKIEFEPGYIYQEIAVPRGQDPSYNAFIKQLRKGKNLQVSEISLQLLFDRNSDLIEHCATYNTLKGGVPIEIQPYTTTELSGFIKAITSSLKRLKAFGPINIQGRITDHGFKAFEINPRFTGITGLRAKLGFNEVEFCIFTLIYSIKIKKLKLSNKYLGIRQVASKKVLQSRVISIKKEDSVQKNILLTGSTGMIGSYLLKQLSDQGHSVSRLYTQEKELIDNKKGYSITDLKSGKINLSNFDTIVHLGFARPNSSDSEIHSSIVNSFELATQAAQSAVDQFIFISSQSVYGFTSNGKFTEDCKTNPQNNYARAKVTVEDHIKSITKLSNETRFTVLRLASVIAPFDSNLNHEAYSSMIVSLLKNKTITLSTPNRLISKIDFHDAVDAIDHFTNYSSSSVYEVVNIAPNKNFSLLETMKIVAQELGKTEDTILTDSIENEEPNNLVISADKARQQYGWESKKSIKKTLVFFKKHFGY